MDKEREVLYNFRRSKNTLMCNEWWFLIKNQTREIIEIQKKIYDLFAPITEEFISLEGIIKGSGLRYKLLNFESIKRVELSQLCNLYRKITKEPKLYHRKNKDGLANYLAEALEK